MHSQLRFLLCVLPCYLIWFSNFQRTLFMCLQNKAEPGRMFECGKKKLHLAAHMTKHVLSKNMIVLLPIFKLSIYFLYFPFKRVYFSSFFSYINVHSLPMSFGYTNNHQQCQAKLRQSVQHSSVIINEQETSSEKIMKMCCKHFTKNKRI